jgi:hypothetical protein
MNGICQIKEAVTPFQSAVIGWAGVLGVCMFGEPPAYAPPFKPSTLRQLRVWHDMMLAQIQYLSGTDRAMIIGYKKFWQSCKAAFLILSKNKSRVQWLAKHLAADAEKRQANSFSLTPDLPKPMNTMAENPIAFEPSNPFQLRAVLIESLLKTKSADDPDVPRLKQCLEFYRRGQFPPPEIAAPVPTTQ